MGPHSLVGLHASSDQLTASIFRAIPKTMQQCEIESELPLGAKSLAPP